MTSAACLTAAWSPRHGHGPRSLERQSLGVLFRHGQGPSTWTATDRSTSPRSSPRDAQESRDVGALVGRGGSHRCERLETRMKLTMRQSSRGGRARSGIGRDHEVVGRTREASPSRRPAATSLWHVFQNLRRDGIRSGIAGAAPASRLSASFCLGTPLRHAG